MDGQKHVSQASADGPQLSPKETSLYKYMKVSLKSLAELDILKSKEWITFEYKI